MTSKFLLQIMIGIIMIIGALMIIISPGSPPKIICIACGSTIFTLLGVAQVVLGALSFYLVGKIPNQKSGQF